MKTKLYCLIALIMACGCTDDKFVNVNYITDETLGRSREFVIDTLNVNDSIYVGSRDFLVYKDSFLVVLNGEPQDGCYLEVRRLDSGDLLRHFFRKGNGPGELLSANVDLNNHHLFVNDYVRSQFSVINLDSAILNGEYHCSLLKNEITMSPTVVPYKDTYIIENPYCYCDSDAHIYQGIEQGVPRFIILGEGREENQFDKYEYDTRNVAVDGRIICDMENKNYVYAHFGKSEVEFYDSTLTLTNMVKGPRIMKTQYSVYSIDGNDQKNVIYNNRIPYCYLGYCCDDSDVYLLYIGDYLTNESDINKMTTYILKFDWKGHFKASYHVGMYLTSISKGRDTDTFYATAIDSKGQRMLIKLY